MKRFVERKSMGCGIFLVAVLSLGAARIEPPVKAVQATTEIAESELLDVAIEVFDPGIPDLASLTTKQQEGIYPEVRKSESRYLAMQLKQTLQSTGFWGAVRVVPERMASAEVIVTGQILKSNGKLLAVEVEVLDISGRDWFARKYRQEANPYVYIDEKHEDVDPFSGLYARIANDMLERLHKLDREEIQELRQIGELRFASQLAPADYSDYLGVGRKGLWEIRRLPAADDPMMQRVATIRERDYMFIDTLNEYYSEFCLSMEEAYDNWRSFSYEEQVALAELRRQARMRKIIGAIAIIGAVAAPGGGQLEGVARDAAMIGGIAAIQSGLAKGKEAKIHAEALRELAASFEIDVAPLVVEIEGETIRLTGSREEQYAAWRELLREIYAAETGLPVDPNARTEPAVEGSAGS